MANLPCSFWVLAPSALAADLTGPVVSVLNGDTIEVLHNQHPERIRPSDIDCPEKGQAYGKRAKQAASELVFGKEAILRLTTRTNTGAPWPMCFFPMALTLITRSSRTAGVGGIGSMRREMQYLKGWRGTHEKPGKACGAILSRCRHGSRDS